MLYLILVACEDIIVKDACNNYGVYCISSTDSLFTVVIIMSMSMSTTKVRRDLNLNLARNAKNLEKFLVNHFHLW